MSAIIMDGADLAKRIKADIRKWADSFHCTPGLAAVVVGDDPASKTYIMEETL